MSLRTSDLEVVHIIGNGSCSPCGLGPPPNSILHIPPPPIPTFLQFGSNVRSNAGVLIYPAFSNDSLCKHSCNWRTEGVQYVEMPHQGTLFNDTWLLVLISSCVGVIFVGLVLAALVLRCKFNGSMKGGSMSIAAPTSCTETKSGRMQNETILYPCSVDSMQDSRVMWATLTPRGTTRHYIEEHTYESIANGTTYKHNYSPANPDEHMPVQPPALQAVQPRLKDDKAFDNTAFIDYEEPLSFESEIRSRPDDNPQTPEAGTYEARTSTARVHVSLPTRIEYPNLPPLNLYPKKHSSCQQQQPDSGHHRQTLNVNSKSSHDKLASKVPQPAPCSGTNKAVPF